MAKTRSSQAKFSTGDLLDNRYRLRESLGEGGVGYVYRALDETNGQDVAIKFLSPRVVHDERQLHRFFREFRAISGLDHPNCLRVYARGQERGHHYFVMEYIAGEDLSYFEAKDHLEMLLVLMQIASALGYIHSFGIIHRDLKPSNILLIPGEPPRPKLMDFGLVKFDEASTLGEDASRLTHVGEVVGTMAYMSPEQILGKKIDLRTDLYALGCMIYDLWTYELPFDQAMTPQQLMCAHLVSEPPPLKSRVPEVPEELNDLALRLLAKEPEKRPQSALEVIDVLKPLIIQAGGQKTLASLSHALQQTQSASVLLEPLLVGREHEMEWLERHLKEILAGSDSLAPIIALVGESGVGKSHLIEELRTNLVKAGKRNLKLFVNQGSAASSSLISQFEKTLKEALSEAQTTGKGELFALPAEGQQASSVPQFRISMPDEQKAAHDDDEDDGEKTVLDFRPSLPPPPAERTSPEPSDAYRQSLSPPLSMRATVIEPLAEQVLSRAAAIQAERQGPRSREATVAFQVPLVDPKDLLPQAPIDPKDLLPPGRPGESRADTALPKGDVLIEISEQVLEGEELPFADADADADAKASDIDMQPEPLQSSDEVDISIKEQDFGGALLGEALPETMAAQETEVPVILGQLADEEEEQATKSKKPSSFQGDSVLPPVPKDIKKLDEWLGKLPSSGNFSVDLADKSSDALLSINALLSDVIVAADPESALEQHIAEAVEQKSRAHGAKRSQASSSQDALPAPSAQVASKQPSLFSFPLEPLQTPDEGVGAFVQSEDASRDAPETVELDALQSEDILLEEEDEEEEILLLEEEDEEEEILLLEEEDEEDVSTSDSAQKTGSSRKPKGKKAFKNAFVSEPGEISPKPEKSSLARPSKTGEYKRPVATASPRKQTGEHGRPIATASPRKARKQTGEHKRPIATASPRKQTGEHKRPIATASPRKQTGEHKRPVATASPRKARSKRSPSAARLAVASPKEKRSPRVARSQEELSSHYQKKHAKLSSSGNLKRAFFISELLSKLCSYGPFVLFLEDLHEAEPSLVTFISELATQLTQKNNFCIVVTMGPGPIRRQIEALETYIGKIPTLELAPLSSKGIQALISSMLGVPMLGASPEPIVETLTSQLQGASVGHPLFIKIYLQKLIEDGTLRHSPQGWNLSSSQPLGEKLAHTFDDLLRERLNQLSPRSMTTLRMAAAIGRKFRFSTLQAISHLEMEPLLDILDEAIHARLLGSLPEQEHRDSYTFESDKIVEQLYASNSSSQRRQLHREIAESLAEQEDVSHAEAAQHFAKCGDLERAFLYYKRAGEMCLARHDFETASSLLQKALDFHNNLPQSPNPTLSRELQESLADALMSFGQPGRANVFLRRLAQHATRPEEQAHYYRKWGCGLLLTGKTQQGIEMLYQALQCLGEKSAPGRFSARQISKREGISSWFSRSKTPEQSPQQRRMRGQIHRELFEALSWIDGQQAHQHLLAFGELSPADELPVEHAHATYPTLFSLHTLSSSEQAFATFSSLSQFHSKHSDPLLSLRMHIASLVYTFFFGQTPPSIQTPLSKLPGSLWNQEPFRLACSFVSMGWCHVFSGEWNNALKRFSLALALADEQNDARLRAFANFGNGVISLLTGRLTETIRIANQIEKIGQLFGIPLLQSFALELRGTLALVQRRPRDAHNAFSQAIEILQNANLLERWGQMLLFNQTEAMLQLLDRQGASTLPDWFARLKRNVKLAKQILLPHPLFEGFYYVLCGVLSARQRKASHAERWFQQALDCQSFGRRHFLPAWAMPRIARELQYLDFAPSLVQKLLQESSRMMRDSKAETLQRWVPRSL